MWTIIAPYVWKVIKNPIYIVIVLLVVLSGWLYTKNIYYEHQIDNLKQEIVSVNGDIETYKKNENILLRSIEKCSSQQIEYEENIELLTGKIQEEKDRVVYWKKQYVDKKCFNNDDEVVKPETGKVLNDERNIEAVRTINSLFSID